MHRTHTHSYCTHSLFFWSTSAERIMHILTTSCSGIRPIYVYSYPQGITFTCSIKPLFKKNLTESSMTNEIRSYVHLSRNTVNRSEISIPSFSIIWLVLEINEQGRIMKEDLNQEVHRKLGKQKHGLNRHEHAKAFPLRKTKWNTGA